MTTAPRPPADAAPAAGRCRPLVHGLLALVLALPVAAWPLSLDRLLAMPLEQLLRLEIGSRRVSQAPAADGLFQDAGSRRAHEA